MVKLLLNAPLEHLRCTDTDNVMRALRVLEYICCEENDCSLSAIAENVDIDKSQISKLLEAFIESGYIKKDQTTDHYFATLKTTTLGNCIVKNIRARKFTSAELKQRYSSLEAFVKISVNQINNPETIGGLEHKAENRD